MHESPMGLRGLVHDHRFRPRMLRKTCSSSAELAILARRGEAH